MSKAIVIIDIPTDYADEYKQWLIDGGLYYLEDGTWTHLKDVEYKVKPYEKSISVNWIKKWLTRLYDPYDDSVCQMLEDWEEENEHR